MVLFIQRPDQANNNACGNCTGCDISAQQIAEMIGQQRELADILGTLCKQLGRWQAERQVAFFLLHDDDWTLTGHGDLTPGCQKALDKIDPRILSEAIFLSAASGDNNGAPFDRGWVRHLYSDIGELLGIFVCLADGPMLPQGSYSPRIALICRLATLAIEQKNMLDELTFKADHDPLTGLYNRGYYDRALGWTLTDSAQTGQSAALLYINLDRLRLVNDVLGHSIGNVVLEQVARRFQACLKPADCLARVGGDEFAVLLAQVTDPEAAGEAAAKLLQSLAEPVLVERHELFINASIGIGVSDAASTPESLERAAYVALYKAKEAGKGRVMHFHASMASTPPERLEMEKRLRYAVERNEFIPYFQPQIDLRTGGLTGAEVLLRWRPEGLGIVSPAAFIPILEETGRIVEVGRWLLRETCRQGRQWAEELGLDLRLGVNVSAIQLRRPDFTRDVEQALSDTGFPAEKLELELTESIVISDFAAVSQTFTDLHLLGVTFALDDFGTGQSSLAYLNKLPLQRLKIDQSFVRAVGEREVCPPLLDNIVRLAGSLGMPTIAEGIETPRQEQVLRAAGCQEAQGYLFAMPMPAAKFIEYCRKSHGV